MVDDKNEEERLIQSMVNVLSHFLITKILHHHLFEFKLVNNVKETKSNALHKLWWEYLLSLPFAVWYSLISLLASYIWLADSVSLLLGSTSFVCLYPGSSWIKSFSLSTDVSKCVSIFCVGLTYSQEAEKKRDKFE